MMKKQFGLAILAIATWLAWPVDALAQKPVYPYTHAYQVSVNDNTQYPCGYSGTPTTQIAGALAILGNGGTLDMTCYTKPITITQDVFSPITAPVTVLLPPVAVSLAANCTIGSNFEICPRAGSSMTPITGALTGSTLNTAGNNYAAGDTGTIAGTCVGTTYKILTAPSGHVATYSITAAGSACTVATGVLTALGGAQPGIGTGFKVNITTTGYTLTNNATSCAGAGGTPGGSGSELQYRSGPATFGALPGSSLSSGVLDLANQTKAPSFVSETANPALSGVFRMSNATDKVCWRDSTNTSDICIYLDGSNIFHFGSLSPGNATTINGAPVPANKSELSSNSAGQLQSASEKVNVADYGAVCGLTSDQSLAFALAEAALPAGGGTLFIPPCATPYTLTATRLAITKSNVLVSGYGAALLCTVADDCVTAGDLTNVLAYNNITFAGLTLIPGAGSPGHSAMRTNAMHTREVDIVVNANPSRTASTYVFNHLWENDDDFFNYLEHPSDNGGTLRCDATFCGSELWGPGPYAVNAGITYLSGGFNFSPHCFGNGIDWNNGNTLSVKDGVIEGYNQYAIRAWAGNLPGLNMQHVYTEVGSCTNPFGNIGIGGLITYGPATWEGGQIASGGVPRFPQAGTPGNTYYGYYIVGKNAGGAATVPMTAGYLTNGAATVNSTNHITVTFADFQQTCPTCTYDGLRQVESTGIGITSPAPYGTGNWAVFTGLTEASICSGGICTFVDTVTSPSSYTVNASGGYSPDLTFWGGSVVLALPRASYSGSPLSQGGIFVSPNLPTAGQINLTSGPTSAYYQDLEPFSPAIVSTPPGAGTLYQPFNAMIFPGFYSPLGARLKGGINYGPIGQSLYPSGGPTDLETWVDSNSAKTRSYVSGHPPYDVGDTAPSLDETGLAFRAPVSISQYINSVPIEPNWLERLYSNLKAFAVPLGSFSVAQIASPSIGYIADVPTGGTLAPATQYCYRATSLDNLGESYPLSTQVCVTTANDGNSTHQVQLFWAPINGVTRGYNVYGRTTGAEQFMAVAPNVRWTGNTAAILWTDTGALTPSGAMPTLNATGQIQAGGKISAPTVFSTVATGTVPFSATSTTPAHMNIDGNAATATDLAAYTNYSVLGSGNAAKAWITPTANSQCMMSDATNFATVTPTFRTCSTGTVTNVSGTADQIAVATGTTTPVISITNPFTFPGPAKLGGILNAATYPVAGEVLNDVTTGTVVNKLAKNGTTGAIIVPISDNVWTPAYIVVAGAGNGGSAQEATTGIAPCTMSNTASNTEGQPVFKSTSDFDPSPVIGDCYTQTSSTSPIGAYMIGQMIDNSTVTGSTAKILVRPGWLSVNYVAAANVKTGNYTASLVDNTKLVVMNCATACTFTLPNPAPLPFWSTRVMTVGASTALISLNSRQFNGGTSIPQLGIYGDMDFYSDGTNYWGQVPIVSGGGIYFGMSSANMQINLAALTQYGIPSGTGAIGAPTVTAPPATKGKFSFGWNLPTDAAAAPSVMQVGYASRGVTGTTSTDTILFTDNDVEYTGSVAVATALPTATTLENAAFAVQLSNHTTGTATAVTVTPATWQISKNGGTPGATLTIDQGQSCFVYVVPAGSAWDANCHNATLVAGTGISLTRAPDTLTVANTGVTSVATAGPLSGGTITTTGTLSCPTCVTIPNLNLVGGIIGAPVYLQSGAGRFVPWFSIYSSANVALVAPFTFWINNWVATEGSSVSAITPQGIGLAREVGATSFTVDPSFFNIPLGAAAYSVNSGSYVRPLLVAQHTPIALAIPSPILGNYINVVSAQTVGSTSQLLGVNLAGATVTNGATVYTGFSMSSTQRTDETLVEVPIPYPSGATARNLCVYMVTANGGGGNLVFTLRQGVGAAGAMADTLLVATVPLSSSANGEYCDTTHSIALAQFDRIDVSIVNGNAGAVSGGIDGISMELVPSGTATGMIIWGSDGVTQTSAATKYGAPFGNQQVQASDNVVHAGMPRAVTAKNLVCYATLAPLVHPQVMTVMQNGSGPGGGLVATVGVGDGVPEEVSDVVHSISFAALDTFSMQYLNASGGTAGTISSCAMEVD
jgi:hypothetical protein